MKKALALLLALVLVLSVSVTAFAAQGTGSITISNPTIDETYTVYKIFDATVKAATEDNPKGVAYSIDQKSPIFSKMFEPDEETQTYKNDFFNYNPDSDAVTKKDGVGDEALFKYLKELTEDLDPDATPVTATTDESIVFDNLPYGYYLITSTLGAAVTINSNTPDVEVVDKNQKPSDGDDPFDKKVQDGVDAEGYPVWVEMNSADIGSDVKFNVSFGATNYDGDRLVKYYSIRDTKSSSLWVEFQDIEIIITDKKNDDEKTNTTVLNKGYYYCANDAIETNEWEYIGTGWGEILNESKPDPNTAQFYLIHYGYDDFEIVIPWIGGYDFEGVQSMDKGYELTFEFEEEVEEGEEKAEAEFLYLSPAHVEVLYSAAVGPDAANNPATNKAELEWVTTNGTFGPDDPQTTTTKTHNMAVIKQDGNNAAVRLEGATFELYSDEACTDPIYVIPTNNDGVYVLDDFANDTSGTNRITSRERYEKYWEDYIDGTEEKPNPNGTGKPRNDMTTPANGQLIIMGLEEGTYYLKETAAPVGYNPLSGVAQVTVAGTNPSKSETFTGYETLDKKALSIFAYKTEVSNYQGVELPSTGGEGTMLLITIGSVLAIGFAVLLITQKKMSAYRG